VGGLFPEVAGISPKCRGVCRGSSRFYNGAGAGRMREWSLEGRERSRPRQTKIRSAVVGNSQVVGERDFTTAKCDLGIRSEK